MAETRRIGVVADELVEAVTSLATLVSECKWEHAKSRARDSARLAGQLLQRLTTMCEVLDEGYATAEVDAALRRVK